MLLGDILNQMARLELKNLALVESGSLQDTARPEVIYAINQALETLYSRYNFREKSLLIEIQEGLTEYKMLKKYSWSQRDSYPDGPHFILDDVDAPYTGDIVRILYAWGPDGYRLPLNDVTRTDTLTTPHPDTLVIPWEVENQLVSVSYQSLPDVIPTDAADTYEFELPRTMGPALRAYAASKLFESIGTQEAIGKSQLLLQTFESYCTDAQLGDTLNTGVSGSMSKFHQRGFV